MGRGASGLPPGRRRLGADGLPGGCLPRRKQRGCAGGAQLREQREGAGGAQRQRRGGPRRTGPGGGGRTPGPRPGAGGVREEEGAEGERRLSEGWSAWEGRLRRFLSVAVAPEGIVERMLPGHRRASLPGLQFHPLGVWILHVRSSRFFC